MYLAQENLPLNTSLFSYDKDIKVQLQDCSESHSI